MRCQTHRSSGEPGAAAVRCANSLRAAAHSQEVHVRQCGGTRWRYVGTQHGGEHIARTFFALGPGLSHCVTAPTEKTTRPVERIPQLLPPCLGEKNRRVSSHHHRQARARRRRYRPWRHTRLRKAAVGRHDFDDRLRRLRLLVQRLNMEALQFGLGLEQCLLRGRPPPPRSLPWPPGGAQRRPRPEPTWHAARRPDLGPT